jgi:hypothetical protein
VLRRLGSTERLEECENFSFFLKLLKKFRESLIAQVLVETVLVAV